MVKSEDRCPAMTCKGDKPSSVSAPPFIYEVISSIRPGLDLLRDYDMRRLSPKPRVGQLRALAVDEVRLLAAGLRGVYSDDSLLGVERGDGLIRILETVNQSFAGVELYPTVEEKAAHLLYFIVKDHPFADRNKRIAAATFALYLTLNAAAFDSGMQPISNNGVGGIDPAGCGQRPGREGRDDRPDRTNDPKPLNNVQLILDRALPAHHPDKCHQIILIPQTRLFSRPLEARLRSPYCF